MAITLKQVVSSSTHGTSLTGVLTSVAAGDTIAVVVAGVGSGGVLSITDTQGNAYVQYGFEFLTTAVVTAKASGSLTVSVTSFDGSGYISATFYNLSGVGSWSQLQNYLVSPSSTAAITLTAADFYIAAVNATSASIESVSEPWSLDANFNTGDLTAATASNSSSATATFSFSGSANAVMVGLSFVAASAGCNPPISGDQLAANLAARLRNAADSADGLTIRYTNCDPNFYVHSAAEARALIGAGKAVLAETA